jgi:hypothetical protein
VPDGRLEQAFALIDAANADDPEVIVVDGATVPKELTHARLATEWVRRLDPDADDAQLLAARAHHLRRWVVPRSSYPEGRAGYLRWRRDQKARHAEEVAAILREVGYDTAAVERVQQIVRKDGLGSDPAVQTHEDALCLVFLETQLADTSARLGHEKSIDVIRKTARKMSAAGLEAAGALPYDDATRDLLQEALTGE